MHPFWNSNTGKLVIGGCGTQIGMVFSCGVFAAILSLCAICVSANVLSIGLTQQVAGLSTSVPVEEVSASTSSSEEVELLLEEVDTLLAELDSLQVNAPVIPAQIVPSTPPEKPIVMANPGQINLYSGPGADYDQVGVLSVGESLEIVGRNGDSTWWLVSLSNGIFAWAPDLVVTTFNLNDTIPVVTVPSLLGQPASSGSSFVPPTPATPTAVATPTPALPPGTPTPAAEASRQFVEDMPSYKRVKGALLVPPISASLSPDGSRIAMTERIKLYTVNTNGTHTDIWLEDDNKQGPTGWVVWSPDGEYIAFVVGFKTPKCRPCESVALLRLSDGLITFLEAPDDMDTDAPRWTQDGRLLVNVHPDEPADGAAYVYNMFGQGQEASGVYLLSTSHEGQKWFPWRPGRIWQAGVSERPDSYVHD